MTQRRAEVTITDVRYHRSFVLGLVVLAGCAAAGGNGDQDGGGDGDSGADRDARVPADTGEPCMPTAADEIVCDGADDDCNGRIDDVDVAGDGICDCLRVALVGQPGQNESSNFQAWIQARGTTSDRIGLDSAPLTAGILGSYDVLILDQLVRDYDADEAGLLRDWVGTGGGVMAMTGYTNAGPDATRPNSLLADIGIQYAGDFLDGPVTAFAAHPLTAGLTSVSFYGGSTVFTTAAAGGQVTTEIAWIGGPVGTVQERGQGRVFVWGDEWVEFDSEWSTIPEIETFWVNVLAWLGPRGSCEIVVE